MPGPQLRSRTGLDPEYRVPGLLLPRFGDETATARQEPCQALTAAGIRAEWRDAAAAASLEPRINLTHDQGHGFRRRHRQCWPPDVAQAKAADLAGAAICPNWPVHKLRPRSRVTGVTNGSAGRTALARYHAAESLSDLAEPVTPAAQDHTPRPPPNRGRDPHSPSGMAGWRRR